jgi:replicative DNA helicase
MAYLNNNQHNQKKEQGLEMYKALPHSYEAEKNFLGALILDGTLLERVREEIGILETDDFANKANQIVYEEILLRAEVSDDFNVTVVTAALEQKGRLREVGGAQYIASLTELTGPQAAIAEYGRIIQELSRRRKLIKLAEYVEKICYNPEGKSVDDIYDEAQGLIFNLAEKNSDEGEGPVPMTEVALKLIEQIKENVESGRKLQGVISGFHELDELTQGFRPGTYNIIAARPGVGKTSFAMNIVSNIAMNRDVTKPALVFSLEMPAHEIAMRLLSSFGRVATKDLNTGNISPEQWRNIIQKVKLLTHKNASGEEQIKLYIDDCSELKPLDLRSRARKISAECGGLSCIMIDYIQLMRGQTQHDNRSQEIGEISRSLKQLSKELQVPIFALAQLNREVEARKDHRPMNSDLRESGSLEQDADMIMFIDRNVNKGDDSDDTKAKLIIGKNRSGATKDIELQFQPEYTTFYDKADPAGEQVENAATYDV